MKTQNSKLLAILTVLSTIVPSLGRSDVDHGNGNLSDELSSLAFRGSNACAVDERLILRAYLETIKELTAEQKKSMEAQIDLQREVYKEYNERWWVTYFPNSEKYKMELDEAKRKIELERLIRANKDKVDQYWSWVIEGAKDSKQFMGSLFGPAACQKLNEAIASELLKPAPVFSAHPVTAEIQKEAYKRGIVTAYPQCFIGTKGLDLLRKSSTEIVSLKDKLQTLNIELRFALPDEEVLEKLFQKARTEIKDVLLSTIKEKTPALRKALGIDPAISARIERHMNVISSIVGCQNNAYLSSDGSIKICKITKHADYVLSDEDAVRVLIGEEFHQYFEKLNLQDLYSIVDDFVSRNPGSGFSNRLYDSLYRIRTEDSLIFDTQNKRVLNIQESYLAKLEDAKANLSAIYAKTWRGAISKDFTQEFITTMMKTRNTLQNFANWDLVSSDEKRKYEEIIIDYKHTLEIARNTRFESTIPARKIVVELEDEFLSSIVVDIEIPMTPAGYLLGRTQQDVNAIIKMLEL